MGRLEEGEEGVSVIEDELSYYLGGTEGWWLCII